jgi:hypothetical protein
VRRLRQHNGRRATSRLPIPLVPPNL